MKKIFAIIAALFISVTTFAQITYGNNRILDNTYIGITGGIVGPTHGIFPLNPYAGIKFGKDITPTLGFNIEGLVGFGENFNLYSKTFIKTTYIGLNSTINFSNLIFSYNPNRIFNLSTEIGAGWIHNYGNKSNDLGVKTAILADLRLTDAWHVFAEPTVYWNTTANNKPQFNSKYAQVGLQVGIVYRFKTSNGTHNFKKYDIAYYEQTIKQLNYLLEQKPTEVIKEVQLPGETITIENTVYQEKTFVIQFAQNSYELTNEAKSILDTVQGTVKVIGFASPEGSIEYNKQLSEKRAYAVKAYLNDLGVEVEYATGVGVVGNASNRVVIISVMD